ncbi:Uncharacterised protein [Mycobacteroides abscessus subsp. abscessus]|nr:Uncharacterised protein [Mycobacteroides abscessus subsp. abscessus]
MPSPMTSSSPSSEPREVIIALNDATVAKASSTLAPSSWSNSTDVDACEIEQPCPS